MLTIKLKRIGKKHQASFRIIVSEKRSKVDGRFLEDLGWFNPRSSQFKLNAERVDYWLKNGAQPTESIRHLLTKTKRMI
jgi:small subunit ribosomal protein S16